jgi:hypothetical protein
MKKIIKLTENQLRNIVSKVIKEQLSDPNTLTENKRTDRINQIANIWSSVKDGIIVNPSSKFNKGRWDDFITTYDVTAQDMEAAKKMLVQRKTDENTQNQRYVNIAKTMSQIDPSTLIIKSTTPKINGMSWSEYRKKYNITPDDINKARAYVAGLSEINPNEKAEIDLKIEKLKKLSTPDPKVTELQKQLKAAGYDLGLTGPNKDGIDGIMGYKTRAAQQKQASDKIKQMGSDSKNTINNTIKDLSQLTPQQQATADALSKTPPLAQNVSEDDDIAMLDNLFKKD